MHGIIESEHPIQKEGLEVWRWMKPDVRSLNENVKLKEAVEFLLENRLSEVPIVDFKQKILGLLSLSTIMQAILNGASINELIEKYYDRSIRTISFNGLITDAFPFDRLKISIIDDQNTLIGTLSQEDVIEGFMEAHKKIKSIEISVEWFRVCFDNVYEGITVVDENGIVRMINEAYSHYLGARKEEAIGQHVTKVIEGTRLHIVLETGVPERSQVQLLKGQEVVAHRIPIWKNNKVIGGIGILVFQGVSDLYNIFDRIQALHDKESNSLLILEPPKRKEEVITFDQIIGESTSIANAKSIARRAAKSPATIMITGESGVGKEIFTKAIHYLSNYREGPFISVNCASIPEQLLESELFGYEEGAFTGSRKNGKLGKFQLAHKGTLFLDEIGDMPLHMQSKILRVLQEREVEPVGGTKAIPIDFRLIAATNRSLEDMVKEKTFREDLFYRLNVIPINIPPLRERKSDIPLLVSHIIQNICKKYDLPEKEISKETMAEMMNYHWPGNIRELVNVVERLVVLVEGPRIYLDDFHRYFMQHQTVNTETELDGKTLFNLTQRNSLMEAVKQTGMDREKSLILQTLIEEKGNKTRAAKKLGISRFTLYNRLRELNIESSWISAENSKFKD